MLYKWRVIAIVAILLLLLVPFNGYVLAQDTKVQLVSRGSALYPLGNLSVYATSKENYNSPPFFIETFRPLNITNIVDLATADGNIILIGKLKDSVRDKVWILKLDSLGRLVWGHSYGLSYENPAALTVDSDGNIVVAGTISLPYSEDTDVFIMKIDPEGNLLWENWYGWSDSDGRYDDYANDVAVDEDGNIIVVGTSKLGDNPSRALVLKVPPSGYGSDGFIKIYWIDDNEPMEANAVTVLPGGDFVVAGYRHYSVFLLGGRNAIWAMRFDGSGNEVWDSVYNKAVSDDNPIDLKKMSNDGVWVYLVGYINKLGECSNGLVVAIKVYNGEEAWSKDYNFNDGCDVFNDVIYSNGDLYVTGHSVQSEFRALILKLDDLDGSILKGYYYYDSSGEKREEGLAIDALTSDVVVFAGYYDNDVFVRWNSADNLTNVQTRYYTSEISIVSGITMLPSGEIVVAGKSLSPGFDDFDGYLVKFNWWGNRVLWSEHYGVSAFNETINDIVANSNGTVLAVGVKRNWDMKMEVGMVLAIGNDGDLLWSRTIGDFGKDNRTSLVSLTGVNDTKFIAVGYTTSSGDKDALVLKFDTNGEIEWMRVYGGSMDDAATDVAVTPDGNILVLGTTQSFGGGYLSPAMWLVEIQEDGSILWQKQYTVDKAAIYPVLLSITNDGTIAVLADVYNFSSGMYSISIILLDSNGSVEGWWGYDGGTNDPLGDYYSGGMTVASNGDLIVTGYGSQFGEVVFRVDKKGTVLWAKSYGLGGKGGKVLVAQNGDIVLTGWTYREGKAVPFLLRIPLNGNLIDCPECMDVNIIMHTFSGIVTGVTSAVSGNLSTYISGTTGTPREIDTQQEFGYYTYRLMGDLDYDWKITSVDALIYLKYVVGLDVSPYYVDPSSDDLTGDKKITIADALKALRIAVGVDSFR